MSKRRRFAMKGTTPTIEETSGVKKFRPDILVGKPIKCAKCGRSIVTLVKVEDHYECQNKDMCLILQMRGK